MYTVLITDHARDNLAELKRFGKKTLLQIQAVLAELKGDPYAMTQELRAPLQGFRSLHVGRFRAVIKIHKKQVRVYVVAVGWHQSGNRDDIYQMVARAVKSGTIRIQDE